MFDILAANFILRGIFRVQLAFNQSSIRELLISFIVFFGLSQSYETPVEGRISTFRSDVEKTHSKICSGNHVTKMLPFSSACEETSHHFLTLNLDIPTESSFKNK